MNGALYAIGAGVTEDFISVKYFTNFAIHRIQNVILTERRFDVVMPEFAPMAFGLPWHEPRTFRIGFKPGKVADYARERTWADQQRLEDLSDGGLVLEITTRSKPELMAWVRSFGDDANFLLEWF